MSAEPRKQKYSLGKENINLFEFWSKIKKKMIFYREIKINTFLFR